MIVRLLRWTWALAMLIGFAACPGSDSGAGAGGAGDGAGQAASAGKSSTAGSGGKNTGAAGATGAAGKGNGAGNGAQAGVPAAGSGGVEDDAGVKDPGPGGPVAGSGEAGKGGSVRCDLQCAQGERCELKEVQCIRAPCPPIPECVPVTSSGTTCGSRGLPPCPGDQFCDFPAGSDCGATDRGGVCKPRPNACTADVAPVCGCDGLTYSNACGAASAGVSVERQGSCQADVPQGSVDCAPKHVVCERGTPKCPAGQVPRVNDKGCYDGDCVLIEACACQAPEDCPQPGSYTCLMSKKHCTPYL